MLVLAGAGSGKTSVITQKIAWLIEKRLVSPEAIVAVTFTNKAAREMKRRVGDLLGGSSELRGLTISTFHSLGLKILRREAEQAGLRTGFSIIDPKDAVGVISELLRGEKATQMDVYEKIHWQISAWKNAGIQPGDLGVDGTNPIVNAAIAVYPDYNRYLRACNTVDLDDLICLPSLLLQENGPAKAYWCSRFRYFLVDEYQDTNGAQYTFIKHLAGQGNGLTLVGDDDQSIYGWRGAMPDNIATLEGDFSNLEVIKLEQNYRSAGRILKIANRLIQNNQRLYEKTLWSELGFGDKTPVMACDDEVHEAERVVSQILRQQFEYNAEYREFAILYRGNHQARIVEQKLREMRIPYRVSGGLSFFDRAEIRDMLAYLRLLTNPSDDRAFLRIINTPRRGIGANTLEKLAQFSTARSISLFDAVFETGLRDVIKHKAFDTLRYYCQRLVELAEDAERGEPVEVFKNLLTEFAYQDWIIDNNDQAQAERKWENIEELLGWMESMGEDLPEPGADDYSGRLSQVVNQIILRDVLDRQEQDKEQNQVHLMTLHAAKGLEFNYVSIVGLEEDILPHRASIDERGIEEERRLLYVGITRAMKNLTLSFAVKRRRYGETIQCEPSRFLEELPQEELIWEGRGNQASPEQQQMTKKAHLASMRSMLGS
jgi:ATP-dependent DNA helicase Rep